MKKLFLFLILTIVACNTTPPHATERLIAITDRGDTIAKLDGYNCVISGDRGSIASMISNMANQAVDNPGGTLTCLHLP